MPEHAATIVPEMEDVTGGMYILYISEATGNTANIKIIKD